MGLDNSYKLLPDNLSFTYRFKDEAYRLLNTNGFPPTCFSKSHRTVKPSPLFLERKKGKKTEVHTVSSEEQQKFLDAFIEAEIFDPLLVAVCGLPTERAALTTIASLVLKRVKRYGILDATGMYCINSLHKCYDLMQVLDKPRVMVVHNIHPKATRERIVNVRDILTAYESTTRILVLLTNDPEGFVKKRLYLKPDVILNLRG